MAGPSDVWAVGYYNNSGNPYQTLIQHWDGGAWSVIPSPYYGTGNNFLRGVAVAGPNDVWAVGAVAAAGFTQYRTLIEHWNGSVWSVVPGPGPSMYDNGLEGVAVEGPNDVWAVGYYGTPYQTLIEHWNGSAWSIVPSPSSGTLLGVAVVGPSDVWAVGYYGPDLTPVERWDGSAWKYSP